MQCPLSQYRKAKSSNELTSGTMTKIQFSLSIQCCLFTSSSNKVSNTTIYCRSLKTAHLKSSHSLGVINQQYHFYSVAGADLVGRGWGQGWGPSPTPNFVVQIFIADATSMSNVGKVSLAPPPHPKKKHTQILDPHLSIPLYQSTEVLTAQHPFVSNNSKGLKKIQKTSLMVKS